MAGFGEAVVLRGRVRLPEILVHYRERGRVHHVVFPHGTGVWLVTRYEDVRGLLSDLRVGKDGRRMSEVFALHSGIRSKWERTAASGSTIGALAGF